MDSSGSVSAANWADATQIIAQKWIKESIQPVYNTLGNHVAARWFASSTARFIDFQHRAFLSSGQTDYTNYVSNLMRTAAYSGGGTDTAGGLSQVRRTDLPTSRALGKNKTIEAVFKRVRPLYTIWPLSNLLAVSFAAF